VNDSDLSASAADTPLAEVQVCRVCGDEPTVASDLLAVEEPLEIRLGWHAGGRRVHRPVSVTMRTPGNDAELAVGFLFAEGIVERPEQVAGIHPSDSDDAIRVDLAPGVGIDLTRLERHFLTSSSCGVCGKAFLAAVHVASRNSLVDGRPLVEAAAIHRLPAALRSAQTVFNRTGGLHAAALFNADGQMICLREDVGRHNAVDKLIGAQFRAGTTPLTNSVLLVSGRVSFELVQKAATAGIPILAAVGAPSSFAVRLAQEHGMTVLGFVRDDRFNVYTGAERIRQTAAVTVEAAVNLAPSIP
jgi:FdhD protein